ncbi:MULTISPECIES: methyltransferase domain-containing protein [Anaeromyxobacter]|uniref:hypothetical protein n=1 Tax=Anaeromyxobacter TaxID=161492 RepID=UPI001F570ECA|nr:MULTISPECIES: hypothetical protein [unclassified Anaeromyxobacter]
MALDTVAPTLGRRPRASRPSPTARELAREALGEVRDAEVLVAAEEAGPLAAALERDGARVTPISLGADALAAPEPWRAIELPTWSFDAVAAEGLLSRAADIEALLYRLRAWVRPDAPFAFVEPLAPAAWDSSPPRAATAGALGARELELVRRHLPGIRVLRLPAPAAGRPVSPWADALWSAVESAATWLPGVGREVRLAVLTGRLPP